ncbi:MAG: hypothetical protein J5725_08685 [Bacteroidales bacterium]|nr:hypothetical protein [Bacteroidales bacterium]
MNIDDLPIHEIQGENDALDQSIALNRITLALLKEQKEINKRMFIIICSLVAAIVVMFFGFLYYESQWEVVSEETTTIEQEVSGDGSRINNVQGDQYNDNSVHSEGVGD